MRPGFGFNEPVRLPTAQTFQGGFNFCRLVYDGNRNGGSWQTDYPNADINMSIRFSELTKTRVAFHPGGEPKHLLVRATADSLFKLFEIESVELFGTPGSDTFLINSWNGEAWVFGNDGSE